jgi:putative MATE family efflux protein
MSQHAVANAEASGPSRKGNRVFALVREALSDEPADYTQGDLNRAVLLLAIPMMLEMALESVFSVVDVFWVGHLGADAVAAVGLTESLLTLVLAVSSGLGTATTAIVARRKGESDTKRASLDAVQSIFVGLVIALAIAGPLFAYSPRLLTLMGATPQVAQVGHAYARITLGTSGIILLLSLNNAIFRGAGDAVFAMRLLAVANCINLVLDPLLIFGLGPFPKLGVAGPAVATLIGRSSAVVYQFYRLLRGTKRICITRDTIRIQTHELWQFLRVSSTGMLQFLLEQGSWLGIIRIVSLFGPAAIAGYTVAFRIIGFALLPALGISNAAATLVGQSIGARMPDRAKSSVWRTALWNFAFLGSISLLFLLFAPFVVGLFTQDQGARQTAAEGLRYFSIGNFFFSFGVVFLQAFNGAGDTMTPTLINLIGFWVIEIPVAYFLGRHTGMSIRGVFAAILGAQLLAVGTSAVFFLRGKWLQPKAILD